MVRFVVGQVCNHDGGKTWGDVSVICGGRPGSGDWYNESYVTPLPDGRWLCMVRLNPNNEHRKMPFYMKRCIMAALGSKFSSDSRSLHLHGCEFSWSATRDADQRLNT